MNFFIISIFFFLSSAYASANCESNFSSYANSSSIKLTVWNTYLGNGLRPELYGEFYESDFLLFQEVDSLGFLSLQSKMPENYSSTLKNDLTYGVANFSRFEPCSTIHKEVDDEPFWPKVDKAIIAQKFMLSHIDGSTSSLLIINVHLPLFVVGGSFGNGAYKKGLREIENILKSHRGPVILAGDFNGWTTNRTTHLLPQLQKQFDLKEVSLNYNNDKRSGYLNLDRVYYRDLSLTSHKTVEVDSSASDHDLYQVSFKLADNNVSK